MPGIQTHGIPYNTKTWRQVGGTIPSTYVSVLGIFNDTLYEAGPNNSTGQITVRSYNPVTNAWTDCGGPATTNNCGLFCVMGSSLYMFATSGVAGGGHIYKYTAPSTWTDMGHLAAATTWVVSLVTYNSKLYATARGDGNVYEYQSGTTWASVGQPGPLSTTTTFIEEFNGKLYAVYNDDASVYDTGTTWNAVASPTLAHAGAVAGSLRVDTRWFINTLPSDGTSPTEFFYYDDVGDSWTSYGTAGTLRIGTYDTQWGFHEGRLYTADLSTYTMYRRDGESLWTSIGIPLTDYVNYGIISYRGKLYCSCIYKTWAQSNGGQVYRLGLR